MQADSLAIDTVLLTASSIDLGISDTAQIVLAELTDDAIYVSSSLVVSNDPALSFFRTGKCRKVSCEVSHILLA